MPPSPSFKESGAILETGNALLDVLKASECTKKCPGRQNLSRELSWLDYAAKEFREDALTRWADDARTATEALLKKCDCCVRIPEIAKELIAEYRQSLGLVVEQENPGQDPEPALA